MTGQMMQKPDSVKPSESVSGALELLVDFLLAEIKAAPVSPHDLLARLKASPPDYLGTVTEYMRSTGFLDGNELNSSALYHALKIDMATGVGNRVLLTWQSESLALHYFPGYTLETPLRQFMMQELTDYPLIRVNVKAGKRRIVHARKNHVNHLSHLLYMAKRKYEMDKKTSLGVDTRRLTIGEFLGLPQDVIMRYPEIYQTLTRYGFFQGTGLMKR